MFRVCVIPLFVGLAAVSTQGRRSWDANHGDTQVVGFVYFEGPVDSYLKE